MTDRFPDAPTDAPDPPGADLRAGYGPAPGFDEAFDPTGAVRPHWAELFNSLRHLDPAELARRWREAKGLIRENGVTYNVYGDPDGIARPWQLDPIPLLIPSAE